MSGIFACSCSTIIPIYPRTSKLFLWLILGRVFKSIFFIVAECADNEYDCEDETCIDASLVCNERNNCKYQKDEAECGVSFYVFNKI